MSVLVIGEHEGGQLKPSISRVLAAAEVWQQPIDLLLYGDQLAEVTAQASRLTGLRRVLVAEAAHLQHPVAEDVLDLALSIAGEYRVILSAHSPFGKALLPGIAARLDVAAITDVVKILSPTTYVRPSYAGNILTTLENDSAVQVITLRATAFPAVGTEGQAEVLTLSAPASRQITRWVKESISHSGRPELGSARVVIAGGRSLGDQFDQLLNPIAADLDAAVGATRACVDAGFAPNDIQVGQTGTIIAPELYIAVGISGAMQHLAGIKDSKVIVAINHDPDAPIFKHADYGLVADLFTALPALHDALQAS